MQSISEAFRNAVRGPHEARARVEIVRDGVVTRVLDAHAGSVTADRGGATLRRFAATVSDPTGELTPAGVRDELAPFGTQARVYRGVRIPRIVTASAHHAGAAGWNSGNHDGTGVDPVTGELILGWDLI